MPKVIELKGKDIVNAYDGNKLSDRFGYSCANFNCDYQKHVDMDLFKIYIDNVDNISCFVYMDNNGLIDGRRMFFKGKQLLDHNVFPIITKLNSEIYYLYGFYGYGKGKADDAIIDYVINNYKNDVIHMDHGHINKGEYRHKREYWVMEIDNMDYPEFPAIDYLYASAELSAFANFNPSLKIREWLGETYGEDDVSFGSAYHFKPGGIDDNFLKHWNQQYYKDTEEDSDDEEVQEEVQEEEGYSTYYDEDEEIQESVKGFDEVTNPGVVNVNYRGGGETMSVDLELVSFDENDKSRHIIDLYNILKKEMGFSLKETKDLFYKLPHIILSDENDIDKINNIKEDIEKIGGVCEIIEKN